MRPGGARASFVDEAVETCRRFTSRETACGRRVFLYQQKMLEMIRDRVAEPLVDDLAPEELDRWARQMADREADPYTLVDLTFERIYARAAAEKWLLLFDHDPDVVAGIMWRQEGRYLVEPVPWED